MPPGKVGRREAALVPEGAKHSPFRNINPIFYNP